MKYFICSLFLFAMTASLFSEGQKVLYQVDGKDYEGYYTSPKEGAPLVLIIHDWDGLTDYEIKRAEMLATQGYAVFAADLFGKGVVLKEIKDRKEKTGELYSDRAKMRSLIDGAILAAQKSGGKIENAVMIGYCFGGAVTLESARAGNALKGFVSFHGGLTIPEGQDFSKTKGSVVVMHGSADTSVTFDDFANLAKVLEEQKVPHEMITYSGAPHAFTVFGSDRYRKDADEKSWKRFLEYLSETLSKQ